MNIDGSIIRGYLNDREDYSSHWLFKSILDNGEYAFDMPEAAYKAEVKEIFEKACHSLDNFIPYNESLFSKLFPQWRQILKDINIIFAVGCPAPYDALTRNHGGREYIIFDLVRFMDYEKKGYDILSLIRKMITHEFAHVCIHKDHPLEEGNYKDKLIYTTFDEGFAHLLAFTDNVKSYDFQEFIKSYYSNSLKKLQRALAEKDKAEQEKYLEEADCGSYWSKLAAISGKLYLAANIESLSEIYENGPASMVTRMVYK